MRNDGDPNCNHEVYGSVLEEENFEPGKSRYFEIRQCIKCSGLWHVPLTAEEIKAHQDKYGKPEDRLEGRPDAVRAE